MIRGASTRSKPGTDLSGPGNSPEVRPLKAQPNGLGFKGLKGGEERSVKPSPTGLACKPSDHAGRGRELIRGGQRSVPGLRSVVSPRITPSKQHSVQAGRSARSGAESRANGRVREPLAGVPETARREPGRYSPGFSPGLSGWPRTRSNAAGTAVCPNTGKEKTEMLAFPSYLCHRTAVYAKAKPNGLGFGRPRALTADGGTNHQSPPTAVIGG